MMDKVNNLEKENHMSQKIKREYRATLDLIFTPPQKSRIPTLKSRTSSSTDNNIKNVSQTNTKLQDKVPINYKKHLTTDEKFRNNKKSLNCPIIITNCCTNFNNNKKENNESSIINIETSPSKNNFEKNYNTKNLKINKTCGCNSKMQAKLLDLNTSLEEQEILNICYSEENDLCVEKCANDNNREKNKCSEKLNSPRSHPVYYVNRCEIEQAFQSEQPKKEKPENKTSENEEQHTCTGTSLPQESDISFSTVPVAQTNPNASTSKSPIASERKKSILRSAKDTRKSIDADAEKKRLLRPNRASYVRQSLPEEPFGMNSSEKPEKPPETTRKFSTHEEKLIDAGYIEEKPEFKQQTIRRQSLFEDTIKIKVIPHNENEAGKPDSLSKRRMSVPLATIPADNLTLIVLKGDDNSVLDLDENDDGSKQVNFTEENALKLNKPNESSESFSGQKTDNKYSTSNDDLENKQETEKNQKMHVDAEKTNPSTYSSYPQKSNSVHQVVEKDHNRSPVENLNDLKDQFMKENTIELKNLFLRENPTEIFKRNSGETKSVPLKQYATQASSNYLSKETINAANYKESPNQMIKEKTAKAEGMKQTNPNQGNKKKKSCCCNEKNDKRKDTSPDPEKFETNLESEDEVMLIQIQIMVKPKNQMIHVAAIPNSPALNDNGMITIPVQLQITNDKNQTPFASANNSKVNQTPEVRKYDNLITSNIIDNLKKSEKQENSQLPGTSCRHPDTQTNQSTSEHILSLSLNSMQSPLTEHSVPRSKSEEEEEKLPPLTMKDVLKLSEGYVAKSITEIYKTKSNKNSKPDDDDNKEPYWESTPDKKDTAKNGENSNSDRKKKISTDEQRMQYSEDIDNIIRTSIIIVKNVAEMDIPSPSTPKLKKNVLLDTQKITNETTFAFQRDKDNINDKTHHHPIFDELSPNQSEFNFTPGVSWVEIKTERKRKMNKVLEKINNPEYNLQLPNEEIEQEAIWDKLAHFDSNQIKSKQKSGHKFKEQCCFNHDCEQPTEAYLQTFGIGKCHETTCLTSKNLPGVLENLQDKPEKKKISNKFLDAENEIKKNQFLSTNDEEQQEFNKSYERNSLWNDTESIISNKNKVNLEESLEMFVEQLDTATLSEMETKSVLCSKKQSETRKEEIIKVDVCPPECSQVIISKPEITPHSSAETLNRSIKKSCSQKSSQNATDKISILPQSSFRKQPTVKGASIKKIKSTQFVTKIFLEENKVDNDIKEPFKLKTVFSGTGIKKSGTMLTEIKLHSLPDNNQDNQSNYFISGSCQHVLKENNISKNIIPQSNTQKSVLKTTLKKMGPPNKQELKKQDYFSDSNLNENNSSFRVKKFIFEIASNKHHTSIGNLLCSLKNINKEFYKLKSVVESHNKSNNKVSTSNIRVINQENNILKPALTPITDKSYISNIVNKKSVTQNIVADSLPSKNSTINKQDIQKESLEISSNLLKIKSAYKHDIVYKAFKACEEELKPIKEALNTVQNQLKNLNMPELDCILNKGQKNTINQQNPIDTHNNSDILDDYLTNYRVPYPSLHCAIQQDRLSSSTQYYPNSLFSDFSGQFSSPYNPWFYGINSSTNNIYAAGMQNFFSTYNIPYSMQYSQSYMPRRNIFPPNDNNLEYPPPLSESISHAQSVPPENFDYYIKLLKTPTKPNKKPLGKRNKAIQKNGPRFTSTKIKTTKLKYAKCQCNIGIDNKPETNTRATSTSSSIGSRKTSKLCDNHPKKKMSQKKTSEEFVGSECNGVFLDVIKSVVPEKKVSKKRRYEFNYDTSATTDNLNNMSLHLHIGPKCSKHR